MAVGAGCAAHLIVQRGVASTRRAVRETAPASTGAADCEMTKAEDSEVDESWLSSRWVVDW